MTVLAQGAWGRWRSSLTEGPRTIRWPEAIHAVVERIGDV